MMTVDKARRIVNGMAARYYDCVEDEDHPELDAYIPAIWLDSLRSCSLLFVHVLMAYATRDNHLTVDEAREIIELVKNKKLEGVSNDVAR